MSQLKDYEKFKLMRDCLGQRKSSGNLAEETLAVWHLKEFIKDFEDKTIGYIRRFLDLDLATYRSSAFGLVLAAFLEEGLVFILLRFSLQFFAPRCQCDQLNNAFLGAFFFDLY